MLMASNKTTSESQYRTGKVERLIDEYDLAELGDELQDLWIGYTGEQRSLRELASWFNQQLLQAEINEVDVGTHSYDIERVYTILTGNDVSSGTRARIHGRLKQDGVNVEQLKSDFVSHLAIRTYLRHHDTTRVESNTDQVAKEAQRIQRLRSRTTTVTESKLEQLRATDRIWIGDFRILTEIQAFCEECETRYDIDELLSQGSCACSVEDLT